MNYKVRLKNNKEFSCESSKTILEAALEQGIALEYSCLSARCRSCVVKVIEGKCENIKDDIVLLEEEKKQGFVLSCNAMPCSDLQLDVKDLGVQLFKKQIVPAKINLISILSPDIVRVELRLPPTASFKFIPGQFVNIIRGGEKRSYSLANVPNIENRLEFLIRNYEGGLFSKYWFEEAKQNDLLRIEGPLGTFFYRDNPDCKHIVLLATGTGIAPIQSLLTQFTRQPDLVKNKEVWLFWGGRKREDLFLEIAFDNDNFRYIPVLSREENWNGEKGYVQDIASKQNIDWSRTQVYACGSPLMIDTSKRILIEKGLQENLFFADSFVSTN
ncbi:FAD-binding oxidoreductase [Capnocytophaga stomatis]|uniref:FAD-binding oxidoreductase n=1 Tax=Capnocytophaga stomatis TaxID=1848904 RepID=A0ABW8Q938_9FLAO|nr:FAD-binding oxidoreductase [Capnocytophaga stomatis]GIJ94272.1 CDP-6-deoxy-L-threo-D-glycero-4-hexulose-3-dehydrase reductase [Capnocytophaga stomatis]